MKINKIIFASDDSHFLDFWSSQSIICKEVLNIEPVLFRITEEDSDFYNDGYGMVKNVKKIEGINTGAQAAIGRMFFTKYFPDDVCLVSDIDLLLIDKEYLQGEIESFNQDSFVIYVSDAYDINRSEANEYVNRSYFDKNMGQLYPYFLNAAKGKTFDKILNTQCSFEEYLQKYKELGNKDLFWGVDECYFSKCINNNDHQVKIEKLIRGYDSPWKCHRRIERHRFPVKLEFENENNAQKNDGIYNFQNLKIDKIIEINLPRPYSKYKTEIDDIIKLILKLNNSMKKIALISTFCDTKEKQNILKENILKIKKLGVDVMCISPLFIEIPYDIIKLCDFFYYTKDNPLLIWPERDFTFWKTVPYEDGFVKMHRNIADYGWAALYQTKKLSQIALNYDYDLFYHLIYDLEIDNTIEFEFISNEANLLHPRRDPNNPDHLWETTLHFMVFDRLMMEKIEKEITIESYLGTDGVAEGEVLKWKNKFNIKISPQAVKDKIYYWENYDFFNYSKSPDYKLFINKHEPCDTWKGEPPIMEVLDSKLRIFFYDVKTPKQIDIFYEDLHYNFLLNSNKFIELEKNSLSVEKLVIDGIDYSTEIKEIIRNISYPEK